MQNANHQPVLPEQPYSRESPDERKGPHFHQPRPRRGRFGRFLRGYLMIVGALTTLYVLVQLLVLLFVEMAKWTPRIPIA